jgi:hypothetical protein
MWEMYATLYMAYQAFIFIPPSEYGLSVTAPTNLTIVKEYKTQNECEDALKAMVKHLKAIGKCRFEPVEKK